MKDSVNLIPCILQVGNQVAFSKAFAAFSSATIRLWRLSNNSLLGISVMSLYLSDPMRSL